MNFDNLSDEELTEWHNSYVLGGFSLIFMVGGMAAGLILSPIVSDEWSLFLGWTLLVVAILSMFHVRSRHKEWMAEMDVRNAKLQEEIDHLNAKLRDWND
jgi:DMSO reductase anchor subunit